MKDYRRLTLDLLRALEVDSATTYRWFGVVHEVVTGQSRAVMAPGDCRRALTYALQNRLYSDFYCSGGARAANDIPPISRLCTMSPFLRSLSVANAGTGSRDSGWQVLRREGEFLVIERHGITIWAHPSEVVEVSAAPLGGTECAAVSMPKELFRLSPGFYMALGNCELPMDQPGGEVRYYWNLQAQIAATAMGLLTTRFNKFNIPFRFKVLADEASYTRADAGVLYLRREDIETAGPVVEESYERLRERMKARTPAFTRELAPGLGFAESPSDLRESFGTSRCQRLTEGILRAHERQVSDLDGRLQVVEDCFVEAGITLDAPYLGPPAGVLQPAAQ
jgi:HopA1 effector protein family